MVLFSCLKTVPQSIHHMQTVCTTVYYICHINQSWLGVFAVWVTNRNLVLKINGASFTQHIQQYCGCRLRTATATAYLCGLHEDT